MYKEADKKKLIQDTAKKILESASPHAKRGWGWYKEKALFTRPRELQKNIGSVSRAHKRHLGGMTPTRLDLAKSEALRKELKGLRKDQRSGILKSLGVHGTTAYVGSAPFRGKRKEEPKTIHLSFEKSSGVGDAFRRSRALIEQQVAKVKGSAQPQIERGKEGFRRYMDTMKAGPQTRASGKIRTEAETYLPKLQKDLSAARAELASAQAASKRLLHFPGRLRNTETMAVQKAKTRVSDLENRIKESGKEVSHQTALIDQGRKATTKARLGTVAGVAAVAAPATFMAGRSSKSDPALPKFDLNTADAKKLSKIPGVGLSKARSIIAFRASRMGKQKVAHALPWRSELDKFRFEKYLSYWG